MAGEPTALLLDCLGTLVRLPPPGPFLRAELRERLDVDVGEAAAAAAMRAEIAFYVPRMATAVDAESLARLRDACARVVRDALLGAGPAAPAVAAPAAPAPAAPALDAAAHRVLAAAPLAVVRDALLGALRFEAFADAAPALERWRAQGRRLVVVSNWDASLPEVLERTGLLERVDGWVASAVCGAAKPDPRPVLAGLALAGAQPSQAWLVGDTPDADVGAARAAGVLPVLVDRTGAGPATDPPVRVVDTLAALP